MKPHCLHERHMEDNFQLQCEFVLCLYIIIVSLSEKKEDCSMYDSQTYVKSKK